MSSLINFVVAMPGEARPLQDWYRLKAVRGSHPYSIFRNEHISLIVSGMGKLNAAAATGYLQALLGTAEKGIWVNVGVAGHHSLPLGTPFLAHKVIDDASGLTRYPPLVTEFPCTSETLYTLDKPDLEYLREAAVDMEASGFLAAAARGTTRELVHCFKVVSDNRENTAQAFNPKLASAMLQAQLPVLDDMLHQLGKLANELEEVVVPDEAVEQYHEHWRFTVSQGHQLRALLNRWQVLEPSSPLWREALLDEPNGKSLLLRLRDDVDELYLNHLND